MAKVAIVKFFLYDNKELGMLFLFQEFESLN